MDAAPTTFELDPARGEIALNLFEKATDNGTSDSDHVRLDGNLVAQGVLYALARAEALAMRALGYTQPNGEVILIIGACRDRIEQMPDTVKVLYLAAYNAAREVYETTTPVEEKPDRLVGDSYLSKVEVNIPGEYFAGGNLSLNGLKSPRKLGGFPLVALAVVGIAAVIGTSYWAVKTHEATVKCDAHKLVELNRVDAAVKLLTTSIVEHGSVDPTLANTLKDVFTEPANREEKADPNSIEGAVSTVSSVVRYGAIAIGVGLVGAVSWKLYQWSQQGGARA